MEHLNKILADSAQKGLLLGLIIIAFSTLIYVSDISLFGFASIFIMIVMFALQIVYLLIMQKKFRNSIGGKISFLQLLVYGFVVLIISAILSSIFSYILYNMIDVVYLENQMGQFMENMAEYMDEDQLIEVENTMTESLADMKNIGSILLKAWVAPVVISLIMALIIKKDINE